MTPAPSRRYLALFFPLLSADRWRREHGVGGKPLALIEKQQGVMRIVAADEAALALGIGPGLGLADARARVPELAAIAHDPVADLALLEIIADDCERYTPSVALDPLNGLILDITGCAHLWDGGEAGLKDNLARGLAGHGFRIRSAIAETPDRARALARHGKTLPIAALDLDEGQEPALRRAGLYTVADLACRPRKPLAARFGMAMVTKLARVMGEEDARITPRRVLPALTVMHRFAEPIAHTDHVLEIVGELLRTVEEELLERWEGGRRFVVSLFRSDGDVRSLAVDTGSPTRNLTLLLRLFRERIEHLSDPLDPGFGYDAVRLNVEVTEPLLPTQMASDRQEMREETNALIDRLSVRLGQTRVRRFASGSSHIPELTGFTVPASAPSFPVKWAETESDEPPLRPLHLFDPPQRIEVMAEVPDGPPRHFSWRRDMHRVLLVEGPERIASEWWKRKGGYEIGNGGLTRDYFRVEDERGCRFWLFRHGFYGEGKQPDWYLHGLFA